MSARTLMAEREQARPKVNDYLLAQAVAAHENYKKSKIQKKGKQTSSFLHQTSDISVAAVPVPCHGSPLTAIRNATLSKREPLTAHR